MADNRVLGGDTQHIAHDHNYKAWPKAKGTVWLKTRYIVNTYPDRAQHHHTKHTRHSAQDTQHATNRDIQVAKPTGN